jgi:hypothetical protein
VLDYFEAKNLAPAFSFLDVWGEEHAHAFTVAKATQVDVLESIRDAVGDAIANGESFETFQDKLEPTLRRLGWWGQQSQIDPLTGEDAVVQLGSPRRLKTIYNANLRSARAAGQWERIERTKALLPYLLYQLGPSDKHRPLHVQKEGLVLPVDDPFWAEWMPPNGWGCKCWVRQLTAREAQARGIDQAPPVDRRPFTNPRTGEVSQVPAGIDPGWHTNPGLARMRTLLNNVTTKLEREGAPNARAAIAGLWREPFARAFANVAQRVAAPAGYSTAAQASLGATSPVVIVHNDTLRSKAAKRAAIAPESFALVNRILDEGRIIDEGRDGARSAWATIDGTVWKAVLRKTAAGLLRVQTLHRANQRKLDRALETGGGRS